MRFAHTLLMLLWGQAEGTRRPPRTLLEHHRTAQPGQQ